MSSPSDDANLTQELVEKIHQFFAHQLETNSQLSEAAKESLTVASECIDMAYKIQRKQASSALLDIYKSHKNQNQQQQQQQQQSQQSQSNQQQQQTAPNPAQFIQSLASMFMNQPGAGAASTSPSTASASTTSQNNSNAASSASQQPPRAPKIRKIVSEAERLAAESFKNQGNEYMKQNLYKEAYDSYTEAIGINDNNAIYYSNRAAASSKLGNHQSALNDCLEAVEIDPTYSKAYGRMGLAYANMDDHYKAKEAYLKAVELDPQNESYRNNLNIAEEKLAETGNASANAGPNVMSMLRSMISNPELMQMAMRSLQDPRLQGLFNMAGGAGQQGAAPSAPPSSEQNSTNSSASPSEEHQQNGANQQSNVNPADFFAQLAGAGSNIGLVGAGQQFLSSMQQSNPELVDNMRRMMSAAFMPPPQNQQNQEDESDRNPPPGYS